MGPHHLEFPVLGLEYLSSYLVLAPVAELLLDGDGWDDGEGVNYIPPQPTNSQGVLIANIL